MRKCWAGRFCAAGPQCGKLSRSLPCSLAAEWIAKIGVVVEEADETVFWLEMLVDCEIVKGERLKDLLTEAHELSAIFTASRHTARATG